MQAQIYMPEVQNSNPAYKILSNQIFINLPYNSNLKSKKIIPKHFGTEFSFDDYCMS